MQSIVIDIQNVSFIYQGSDAPSLRDISLQVNKGEVVVLCGESGCGKSSIIRLINGLIPFYHEGELTGRVMVDGIQTTKDTIYDIGQKVSTVFQNPRSQFFCVDVMSELAFAAENLNVDAQEILHRIDETVRDLHLEKLVQRTMFQLSGGEKQKIACACVSVAGNDIIVLDEPSSNLDMSGIRELSTMIAYWKKLGKTVVVAEHRLMYLMDVADRFFYIKNGRIEAEYSNDAFSNVSDEYLKSLGLRSRSLSGLEIHNRHIPRESITLEQMHYSYRGQKTPSFILDSLEVPKDAVIAIVGNNGAGKSTFARTLCGLAKSKKSRLIDDNEVLCSQKRLDASFMVMQDVNHQLFTESVDQEVMLGLPCSDEFDLNEALSRFELSEYKDKHPMALSGGQKQRVAVACACACGRDYIVFDEPTSGLDYNHMEQIAQCILQLQNEGKTIFLITHDLELIYACCNHVVHIDKGKVVDSYTLDDAHMPRLNTFFQL